MYHRQDRTTSALSGSKLENILHVSKNLLNDDIIVIIIIIQACYGVIAIDDANESSLGRLILVINGYVQLAGRGYVSSSNIIKLSWSEYLLPRTFCQANRATNRSFQSPRP